MNIVHVEDDKIDAYLILHELNKNWAEINYYRIDKLVELTEALKKKWDIILSDFDVGEFDGASVLRLIRDYGNDTPVIMVSGTVEEDIVALARSLGAADYISKDNLGNLVSAISREIKRVQD